MEIRNLYDSLQVLEPRDREWSRQERLTAMERPLLAWYEAHARVLPWRETPTPYRVWISEIMLQQTRVEAVKPYFERFIGELPDVAHLAAVEDDRLMKLWEGLGYYNRARNLKKAANQVMELHGGVLPADYNSLLTLTGIGSYTAGAIASIAYRIPVPAVDGNVLRVISRVLADEGDITTASVKKQMESSLKACMPADRAGDYNQALMEIGAMICIPNGQARCEECPLASVCLAKRLGIASKLPVKTKKKARRIEERTVLIIENGTSVSIHKRQDTGLLAGLYELPNLEGRLKEEEIKRYLEELGIAQGAEIEPLPAAKHIFSHVEWRMVGYRITVKEQPLPDLFLNVEKRELAGSYALPAAFRAYTEKILR